IVFGACVVFPLDSDAAFVVFDPIWYGLNAAEAPERSVVAHHLLFHVLVIPLTQGLRAAGFGMPGHLATRVLSGLGAAAILLLFVAMAGPRRRLAGMGVFLLLLSSGGILLEAFTGENILPACAAALGAIWLASRPA